MARAFAAEVFAPNALAWDEAKHFPVAEMRKAAALGMGGIFVGEDVGGSGLSRLTGTLIFEALATGCPRSAAFMSIHNMTAGLIDAFGSDEQRRQWLPKLCTMELVASYCLSEPGAGSDAAALTTRAIRDGNHYVLNGQKQFISGARRQRPLPCHGAHRRRRTFRCFRVARAQQNRRDFRSAPTNAKWAGMPNRPGPFCFEDARVPLDHRLGAEGSGFKIAMAGLDGGRLNIAACSLGGAQCALDKTLAYMSNRKAFGKRLDEFQALQFRLADMATALETSRALLWHAAAALDRKDAAATRLSAMAKRFITDACFEVANQALQLHGGYGYLAEYGIEKIVRDLRVHQILEGTNEIMRLIVARSLIGR